MILTSLILCFCIIVTCIYWYWSSQKRFKSLNKFPGPPGVFLLGNVFDLGNNQVENLKKLYALQMKYGNIYRLKIGWFNLLVVTDPEMLEFVYLNPKYNYKDFLYNVVADWLGNGLINATGEQWTRNRKILNPAFHIKILESYLPKFSKNVDIFITKLEEKQKTGKIFDTYPLLLNFALDVLCETLMGIEINAQSNSEHFYIKNTEILKDLCLTKTFTIWKQIDFIYKKTNAYKEEMEALNNVNAFIMDVIQKRRQILEIENNEENTNDKCKQDDDSDDNIFRKENRITSLIDIILKSESGRKFYTDKDILDEMNNFMFAGHDSTATCLLFTLYLIAKCPEVQNKMYDEVSSIFNGDDNKILTMQDYQEMKYTERIIKESLRLFPPGSIISRTLENDTYYKDTFLPKGTVLLIFIYGLHRDPKYFNDPLKFDPDRFLSENMSEIKKYSYIPFSLGPRNCIGQKYAMFEIKCLLSKLVYNYNISLINPDEPLVIASKGVLTCESVVYFNFDKR